MKKHKLDNIEGAGGRRRSIYRWTREDYEAIKRARERGVTWAAIAAELGLKQPATAYNTYLSLKVRFMEVASGGPVG